MTSIVNVKVVRNDIDYDVLIGNSVYEMNSDAAMPNGVCIYIGELDNPNDFNQTSRQRILRKHPLPENKIPAGILRQTERLLRDSTFEFTPLEKHVGRTRACPNYFTRCNRLLRLPAKLCDGCQIESDAK